MVRKDFPANTLPEFIAYAKANQDKLQFGSGGAGSTTHMVCILLNMALGINTTHIPYRGTGPALQDLAGGRLDYQCEPVPSALPLIQGNAAKPLALLASKRTKVLPDIPTAEEQGLKDFEVLSWNALFLPKGTPEPIVRRLNAAMTQALDTPWVRERLEKLGLEVPEPAQRTPEYLATFLESEIKRWAAPIKASGVSVE
jgi:tripartite-type tricarboxylate transporter receptor subunit TctC